LVGFGPYDSAVTGPDYLLLFAAGIGAGLSGSVAGLASLFSYPALLAVGLPPLTANVTNTVALIFSSVGSVAGSRPELRAKSRSRLAGYCAAAALGGLTGGLLLLLTPHDTFERVVPILIGLASLGVLLPRRRVGSVHTGADPRWLLPTVAVIGIYGGYFGAAAGTLLLAVFLLATSDTMAGCSAIKNLTIGASNAVAAVIFLIISDVRWEAVGPMAVGLLIGSRTGPVLIRHAPAKPLRWLIALAGVGLAVRLALQEY
jgi:uncharacterized membrane protein YfcA